MPSVFRDRLLAGKSAFVTGGSSGICLRIAERFAEHGASVAILGRKPDKLETAAAALSRFGGPVLTHAADVRDYAAVEEAFRQTHAAWGPVDIVIAGAAGNFPAAAAQLSANGFKSVVDIDLIGTFHACRASYSFLRKPGASLIAISASHAWQPIPFQAHVCAGKAGVDLLLKTLAIEWGPEGVRCNILTPGPTDETEGMSRLTPTAAAREQLEANVPLRRYGTKDELADLALFLCSDAAAYITGGVFVCDGGSSLARSSGHLTIAAEHAQR
jgi:NAD(P)-dependent dehydrogenase (short-subunit alcohol dehydrogenase family)